MSDIPTDIPEAKNIQQVDFERVTQLVTSEFQIEESMIYEGVPTFYLKWPQETKQAFLRLLGKLEEINMIAFLRKVDGRVVLRVGEKPPVKPSNPRWYWVLFLATIGSTFLAGYFLLPQEAGLNPFISGAISKTINMPKNAKPEDVAKVYLTAYEKGCKGITIFRYGTKKIGTLVKFSVED